VSQQLKYYLLAQKEKWKWRKYAAGYKIEGLDIAGFNRSSLIKNISLPFKLVKSFLQVRTIVKNFHPDAIVGVGGYSSFPVLRFGQARRIPTFIHESNSFAANRISSWKKSNQSFVATDGLESFFQREDCHYRKPVRAGISQSATTRNEGINFFGLDENKRTVFAVGGSLGAKSINEAISKHLDELLNAGLQLIWQTVNLTPPKEGGRQKENHRLG
jgi:UDP-N-acetylglucosamine--N-acetylmuramyl-(pentapeptide) pyrophosphoryl-undecaprenol N-acetylglucosamine transferase